MAFRPMLRQSAAPAMAVVAGSMAFYAAAPRQLHAEEHPFNRKPIYDDEPLIPATAPKAAPSTPYTTPASTPTKATSPAPLESYRPTPTDRLAAQISHARLLAYAQATRAEDAVNRALTSTLRLEHSFTSTIRGLAPPKESGENIFPGALYVLVASMAGSIVSRNRNIVLRATVPAAIGLGAAYAVLPITMRNVGDLAWTYEERYPVLADAHLRTRERVTKFVETGKAHSQMGYYRVVDKVSETRERLEDWVKRGR